MNDKIINATAEDSECLAELRIVAMKESLENVGRFDPTIARDRFLSTFVPGDTHKVCVDDQLVGFYVLKNNDDHYHLDHLYFHPKYQGVGLGTKIITYIKTLSKENDLPVRLGALRDSRSNEFYKKNGFIYTHEDEWDIYYQFLHS